jgi:hypothetical protein
LTKIPDSGKANTRGYANNSLRCGLKKYSAKEKKTTHVTGDEKKINNGEVKEK